MPSVFSSERSHPTTFLHLRAPFAHTCTSVPLGHCNYWTINSISGEGRASGKGPKEQTRASVVVTFYCVLLHATLPRDIRQSGTYKTDKQIDLETMWRTTTREKEQKNTENRIGFTRQLKEGGFTFLYQKKSRLFMPAQPEEAKVSGRDWDSWWRAGIHNPGTK